MINPSFDYKKVIKVLRGMEAFVSKDETRFNLSRLHVDSDGVLEATNGYMQMRVRAFMHGLESCHLYDIEETIAALQLALETGASAFPVGESDEEKGFPLTSSLMVNIDSGVYENAKRHIVFDPALVSRALKATDQVARAILGVARGVPIRSRFVMNSGAEPMGIDVKEAGISVAIMPMRL